MNQQFLRVSYLLTILLVLSVTGVIGQEQVHDPYSFACSSAHYMLGDFDKQPSVRSPDGIKAVQLTEDYKFRVVFDKTVVSNLTFPDISSNIEIGWSPDSSQVFISYSDGGETGGYQVHLYRIARNELKESEAPSRVAASFKAKHWCQSRGNNLFFLDWTPDSKIGLFVAEVYPTGDCGKELGLYRGYVVDVEDGRILRVLNEKQTGSVEKSCRASGKLVLPPG